MTLTDKTAAPGFTLDHIGMVVADLDAAVSFYTDVFGFSVVSREADTRVDDVAIGLPGESVHLRGAILRDTASNLLEMHQYLEPTGTAPRRVCDEGLGHFAFAVEDIAQAYEYLSVRGVIFNSEPRLISEGELAGRRWVYGRDPFGTVIELCQHNGGHS